MSFPVTRHSVVRAAASPDPEARRRAFSSIVEAYWKAVSKYVRLKWLASTDEAEDLTQAFFARAFEKQFFTSYDPAKARFRTFLARRLRRERAEGRAAAEARRGRAGGAARFQDGGG